MIHEKKHKEHSVKRFSLGRSLEPLLLGR